MQARRWSLLPAALLAAGALAVLPSAAFAHPDACAYSGKDVEHTEDEGCFTEEQIAGFDDSASTLQPGETASTRNMHHLANLPKSGPFAGERSFGSDLAFWDNLAFQGNYNGVQITDISDPEAPQIVSQIHCPGAQNDVSVWKGLLFTSTDSSRNKAECEGNEFQTATKKESWEGIRVFDVSDPANPRYVTAVETDCGSHTHTLIPDEANGRVLLYVSSYSPNAAFPDCQPPHDKISVVEVPLAEPSAARVIGEPVLFPDGGTPSGTGRQTDGCHDITVFLEIDLAAGACTGQGSIFDISDRENPREIARLSDPNFAFWHSATFSDDGRTVIFTDELGGGGAPTCNPTVGDRKGADAIYDIRDPRSPTFQSYFKIPRTQSNTENCVAHNGSVIPARDRDLFVQSWYQGGTSVIDFTDRSNPKEIAYFDRGPLSSERRIIGGTWSTYWYRGKMWSNDIQQGLDVFLLSDPAAAGAGGVRQAYFNPQTQERLR